MKPADTTSHVKRGEECIAKLLRELRYWYYLLKGKADPLLLPDSAVLFGEKTWEDVRRMVMRRLQKKYGGRVQFADLEDAASSAMVDLVDYWVHLPSSIAPEDIGRNFAYAVTRGYWIATTHVFRRVREQSFMVSLDERVDQGPTVVRGPEPEDFEPTEDERVRDFLSELPEEEFTSWLSDYLAGRSEREAARQHQVSPSAIQQRRMWGLRRVSRRYHEYMVTRGG